MLTDEFFLGTKLYHNKLAELCKPLADYLGITQGVYVNIDKNSRFFGIYTHSGLGQRVVEEEYYKTDPFLVHPNNIHNGFALDNASTEQEFKDTFLYDATINFNCYHSFVYTEKTSDGGYYGFAFATAKDNYRMNNRLMNETQIIKKAIRDLNNKLSLVVEKDLQENRMDFATLKGDLFHQQKGLVFNEQSEIKSKIHFLEKAGFLGNSGDQSFLANISLSPQEINCLRIYLTTHSIKKVSRDLNLAVTTVASYVENIKNKLNCNNKNDLFEKGEILCSLGRL
ncbi:MAG TPA: LuxR C-terminal-related transcriptional regulator [Gammaproteobacteria bacterium]|nr:LuxR C-terminal-related transcriptional regulator [Gammaproteobacteria bacterium]